MLNDKVIDDDLGFTMSLEELEELEEGAKYFLDYVREVFRYYCMNLELHLLCTL